MHSIPVFDTELAWMRDCLNHGDLRVRVQEFTEYQRFPFMPARNFTFVREGGKWALRTAVEVLVEAPEA